MRVRGGFPSEASARSAERWDSAELLSNAGGMPAGQNLPPRQVLSSLRVGGYPVLSVVMVEATEA